MQCGHALYHEVKRKKEMRCDLRSHEDQRENEDLKEGNMMKPDAIPEVKAGAGSMFWEGRMECSKKEEKGTRRSRTVRETKN